MTPTHTAKPKDQFSLPKYFTERKAVFSRPDYVSHSSWTEHIPFAFWLVDEIKPRCMVELGSHYGTSYFTFCQAVVQARLNCRCFAVDTWKGDEHSGFYDESVFHQVNEWNLEHFASFSTLVRKQFDEAVDDFEDNSIDLLHIDGLHTYEAVKKDYEVWLPKLSDDAIVLFHDVAETQGDFGVWKFFEEVARKRPSFRFLHCHGLGVLAVNPKGNRLTKLFGLDTDQASSTRSFFFSLGKSHSNYLKLCKEQILTKREQEKNQQLLALNERHEQRIFDLRTHAEKIQENQRRELASLDERYEQIERTFAGQVDSLRENLEQEKQKYNSAIDFLKNEFEEERQASNKTINQLHLLRKKEADDSTTALKEMERLLREAEMRPKALEETLSVKAKELESLQEKNQQLLALNERHEQRIFDLRTHAEKIQENQRRELASLDERYKQIERTFAGQVDSLQKNFEQEKQKHNSAIELHLLRKKEADDSTTALKEMERLLREAEMRTEALGETLSVKAKELESLGRNYAVSNIAVSNYAHQNATLKKKVKAAENNNHYLINVAREVSSFLVDREALRQKRLDKLQSEVTRQRKSLDAVKAPQEPPVFDYNRVTESSIINDSGLFDANFYAKSNQLALKPKNLITHYLKRRDRDAAEFNQLIKPKKISRDACKKYREDWSLLTNFIVHGDREYSPSPFFDSRYYLRENEDLLNYPLHPIAHFFKFGWKENRNPCALFDTSFYRSQLSESVNPLEHYCQHRGRNCPDPHPLFDTQYYLSTQPDVDQDGAIPLQHFIEFGSEELRSPHVLFSLHWYLRKNRDLAKKGINLLQHYVEYGEAENRQPNHLFDPSHFRSACAAKQQILKGNLLGNYARDTALFCNKPHQLFDGEWYLDNYEDVGRSSINPLAHYLSFGEKENRRPLANFDPKWYRGRAPSLYSTIHRPTAHFIESEYKTNRESLSKTTIQCQEPRTLIEVTTQSTSIDDALVPRGIISEAQQNLKDCGSPSVSVIMPVWNRESTVVKAIESVLAQSWQNFQLIISDDGSEDQTIDVIRNQFQESIEQGKILILSSIHKGVSAARNNALLHAKGDFIAYLDSDNEWRANHLLLCLAASLSSNKSVVYSDSIRTEYDSGNKTLMNRDFNRFRLLQSNFVDLNALVHRRCILSNDAPFDEQLKRLVDWDLILDITRLNPALRLPVITVDYNLKIEGVSNISHTEPLKPNVERIQRKNLSELIRNHLISPGRLKDFLAPSLGSVAVGVKSTPKDEVSFNVILESLDNLASISDKCLSALDYPVRTYLSGDGAHYLPLDGEGNVEGAPLKASELIGPIWNAGNGECLPGGDQLRSGLMSLEINSLGFVAISYDLSRDDTIAHHDIEKQLIFANSFLYASWRRHVSLEHCKSGRILHIPVGDYHDLHRTPLGKIHGKVEITSGKPSILECKSDHEPIIPKLQLVPWRRTRKVIFVLGMKVAVGGVERNTVEIMRELKKTYHIVYITLEKVSPQQGSLAHQVIDACDRFIDLAEIADQLQHLECLRKIKEIYAPDAVWICNGSMWLCRNYFTIRDVFANIPIIDQEVYDCKFGWIQHYNDPGLRTFDHFIAINERIRKTFVHELGFNEDRISLIYSALDSQRFRDFKSNEIDIESLRKSYGVPNDVTVYAFVGRLTEQKQPLAFLNLVEARKQHHDEYFLLLGNGPLRPDVEELISDKMLGNVQYIPYVEKLEEVWSFCDGLIITSIYEGLPIAMLEAMVMETPVLATDVGDIKLILDRYHCGITMSSDYQDADSIEKSFERFKSEIPTFKENLRSNASNVSEFFSAKTISGQYITAFESAMELRKNFSDRK